MLIWIKYLVTRMAQLFSQFWAKAHLQCMVPCLCPSNHHQVNALTLHLSGIYATLRQHATESWRKLPVATFLCLVHRAILKVVAYSTQRAHVPLSALLVSLVVMWRLMLPTIVPALTPATLGWHRLMPTQCNQTKSTHSSQALVMSHALIRVRNVSFIIVADRRRFQTLCLPDVILILILTCLHPQSLTKSRHPARTLC